MVSLLVLNALAFAACGDAGDVRTCEATASQGQAIVRGNTDSQFLALSSEQQNAVVYLELMPANDSIPAQPCSGVLITKSRILTAQHCTQGYELSAVHVFFGPNAAEPEFSTLAHFWSFDPSSDLMYIDIDSVPTQVAVPLSPIVSAAPAVGALVELAGFGYDENFVRKQRRFAVETLVAASDQELIVSGEGNSGACGGDSGGPLLIRDDSGVPRAVGVLSKGSSNCMGQDHYVSLLSLRDWIPTEDDPPSADTMACGNIDRSGRCYAGLAVWCDGTVRGDRCDAESVCGWSAAADGFRCVRREDDDCEGVGTIGGCRGETLLECERGVTRERRCDSCDRTCRLDSRTGRYACMDSAVMSAR